MARNRKQRRQQHGSAWHWKQTDCWYYTEPGAKTRVPLFDEDGERIRGKENKETARVALARIKLADELSSPAPPDHASGPWSMPARALRLLSAKRDGLLAVLDHPNLPLHNDLSENDIREYARLRKVSGGTRSDRHGSPDTGSCDDSMDTGVPKRMLGRFRHW